MQHTGLMRQDRQGPPSLPSHTIDCSLQDPEPRHRSTYIKPLLMSVRRTAIEEHC